MWEVIFANVPVECRIVHSNIDGFFYCSGQTIFFSSNYFEIIDGCCVTPVSLKLKNLTRTKKGEGIIKRAERQLLNERIRNINYKIEKFEHDKHMYERQLREILKEDQVIWDACKEEVLKRTEMRHQKVQKRQMSKIEKLINVRKKQEQGGRSNKEVDDRTKTRTRYKQKMGYKSV